MKSLKYTKIVFLNSYFPMIVIFHLVYAYSTETPQPSPISPKHLIFTVASGIGDEP